MTERNAPGRGAPIGVFDSGLGGLTAVRELRRILPGEDIVYFGDTGRVPYGTRGVDVIVRYAKQDIAFLLEQNVKYVMAACGTVSSTLPEAYTRTLPVPYTGVVQSAAAAAVMLLAERGQIDLMDGVDRYLPGFRNARVVDKQGTIRPATRAPWLMELLGMTAGVCYPDSDPAGQYAAKVFDEATQEILAGGGVPTVEFCNRLGQQPLSFQPGTHWRYSTCADILGAVVEVVSGMRFGEFLRKEFFEPLDMVDTGFYVPESKRNRLVTVYKRTESGLVPWTSTHLAVGVYDREPAFESGGAGLVSTLEDYSHFADMLLAGGTYEGRRILSPATVACMTQPQLKDAVRRDMWDSLDGYSYGHLMRICAEPGRIAGLACAGEYGWDGWLGTYFANFPGQQMTILSMQNTVDSGTTRVVRQMRNAVLASLSREN